jgi:hypothetical protein
MSMKLKVNLNTHFFLYIMVLLVIIVIFVSFYRFVIKQDYFVWYEGACDPAIESCFVGCEDDDCTNEYYYSQIHKYAPDLYEKCGEDITDCPEANMCLATDRECFIIFCNPEVGSDVCAVSAQDIDNSEDLKTEDLINDISPDNIIE